MKSRVGGENSLSRLLTVLLNLRYNATPRLHSDFYCLAEAERMQASSKSPFQPGSGPLHLNAPLVSHHDAEKELVKYDETITQLYDIIITSEPEQKNLNHQVQLAKSLISSFAIFLQRMPVGPRMS